MDHYRKIQNVNGQIQVLGEEAIRVDKSGSPVEYKESGFDTAEEIKLGIGNRFAVPPAQDASTSNTVPIPSPNNVSLPFMTQRMTIPSSTALFLMIAQTKIAAVDLIDGDPIAADVFSEVSLNNGVRYPTINTGQNIQIQIGNTDPNNAHEPRLSLSGVRLR